MAGGASPPTSEQLLDAVRNHAAELAEQQSAKQRAQAAMAEEQQLGQARAAAAQKLRVVEDALARATAGMADLAARRDAAEARVAARAAALAPLLPLIERLSLYPAETLLAVPTPPEQAVRGVLVLGGVTRMLAAEASALRKEQAALNAVRDEIRQALPALAREQFEQAHLSADLDAELARTEAQRIAAEADAIDAARRAAADAATADGLRSALARIEADRRAAEQRAQDEQAAAERRHASAEAAAARRRQEALARPPEPDFGKADPAQAALANPGAIPDETARTGPVAGRIVRAFGAATEAGPASGVSYQAPPRARVVSPCHGRVVFAGPFRSFGLLMIVDCGGGYHVVLSGLDRLDAQVGQPVQTGEPVGVMPTWEPRSGASGAPLLYFELRKDGVPVNPAPFLRARL